MAEKKNDPKPGTFPYNVNKRAAPKGSVGGQGSREKVRSIVGHTATLEAAYHKAVAESFRELQALGVETTRRKPRGDWYVVGQTPASVKFPTRGV